MSSLSVNPDCRLMLANVPFGISLTGCGTVTRPGFGWVFELNVITFLSDLKPSIHLKSFYEFPAVHKIILHTYTHSSRANGDCNLLQHTRPMN